MNGKEGRFERDASEKPDESRSTSCFLFDRHVSCLSSSISFSEFPCAASFHREDSPRLGNSSKARNWISPERVRTFYHRRKRVARVDEMREREKLWQEGSETGWQRAIEWKEGKKERRERSWGRRANERKKEIERGDTRVS